MRRKFERRDLWLDWRRGRLLFFTLLAMVSLFGGGCSGEPERKKLTLFLSADRDMIDACRERLDEFEALHPDWRVEIINGAGHADSGMQKLQLLLAGGEAPDVAYVHGSFFPILAGKGLLRDLEELNSAAETPTDLSIYLPRVLELCRIDGKLYSLPMGVTVFAIFYNRSLFDELEVPLPEEGWTWADFLDRARKLTADLDGDGRIDTYGCAVAFEPNLSLPWVRQAGGDLMTPDDRRCILDSEAATEALSFLLDLKNRYHVTPDVAELAGQSQNRMFLSGVIGMTLGVSGSLQSLEKQCGRFDWDIAPLPRYREQAGRIGTANWVVPAGSAHPQMAWELLTFLAGTDGQRHLMKRIGLMPSVAEILESGEFEELMPRRNLQTLIDAISYGRPGCRFYYWAQVRRALEPGFERLWLKETTGDVASELTAMTREANALIQAAENEESAVRRSGEQMEQ